MTKFVLSSRSSIIPNRAIFPHKKQNPALAANEYTHANNSSRKLSVTNDTVVQNAIPEMNKTADTHINPRPNAKSPLTAFWIETLKTNAHAPKHTELASSAPSAVRRKRPPPLFAHSFASSEDENGNENDETRRSSVGFNFPLSSLLLLLKSSVSFGEMSGRRILASSSSPSMSQPQVNILGSSPSSASACLRLQSDLRSIRIEPPEGCSASPHSDDNLFVWSATICGPQDSPWEGGIFSLRLTFSDSYPASAPRVRFVSEMFHPNIYPDGTLCMDTIQEQWSPVHSVASLLTSVRSLLCDPNVNSPANPQAAKMLVEEEKEYNKRVRRLARKTIE
ncbi:unnamed protein product [Bathycoccus prasinos]